MIVKCVAGQGEDWDVFEDASACVTCDHAFGNKCKLVARVVIRRPDGRRRRRATGAGGNSWDG